MTRPDDVFAVRWWRTAAAVASVLLISGAVYVAGLRSDEHTRSQAARTAYGLCETTRVERIEGNRRAHVLITFLETAVAARLGDATIDQSAEARRNDQHAAEAWHNLIQDVHLLPIPNCARLIR